jgi:hypothetical protein
MDAKLKPARTADHGAGLHHRLARGFISAAGVALWICLACWAGIEAAVNGGDSKKKAKWTRRIRGAIQGSLRRGDFWSLHTGAAATKQPTTQELAELTLDPTDLRLQALLSSPLPARLSQSRNRFPPPSTAIGLTPIRRKRSPRAPQTTRRPKIMVEPKPSGVRRHALPSAAVVCAVLFFLPGGSAYSYGSPYSYSSFYGSDGPPPPPPPTFSMSWAHRTSR